MRISLFAISLSLLSSAAVAAEPPRFRVDILPFNDGALGINDNGQILQMHAGNGRTVAAILDGNKQTLLGTLGGALSRPNGINNLGQVVGDSETGVGNTSHAFLYSDGKMTDLGTLGGNYSSAYGITDNGTVLGSSRLANGDEHGFIYTTGSGMVDIGTLGGRNSSISDIDDAGRILGKSQYGSGTWYNFIYENGAMTKLETPNNLLVSGFQPDGAYVGAYATDEFGGAASYFLKDGVVSYPYDIGYIAGIDPSGYAVGYNTHNSLYAVVAMLNGETYRLDDLVTEAGWSTFASVDGMNSLGQIVGQGCREDTCHSVLLTPVPEPATYAMLGAGLAMIGWARRRQQRATA
ncbi:HAF repeat-containing PEP-CTERM protein [Pseudoduganella umbonata]|uniref:PEP-CTERM sorting domain-containing protein n=1 Tax=Pseudoduganella umbonata TaxID=864828 RepID=A0A4P8HYX8_9BURK|nr:HAF repeat-containing PEP-CTERM protein [Pseudoduganella umbonata]MBB3222003.1 putative HAF family extracellular repeat protein [Pseudoduganella umbonata]QCP14208.1 PEP-CTERM sorting domain-containing protein [Pseudoduganella umbonata]